MFLFKRILRSLCVFMSIQVYVVYKCIFLMHSAMGRLGVHKSFIVDVTSHFGSSTLAKIAVAFSFRLEHPVDQGI